MALHIGSKAPDFTLPSTKGIFTLSQDFKGKPGVIYFYPRDFTSVCTKEACAFGAECNIFKSLGIDVIGISRDTLGTHLRFKEQYELPFELLSDTDGTVAKKYKALIPIVKITKRVTYLLDENHIIVSVCKKFLEGEEHVKKMLSRAESLK